MTDQSQRVDVARLTELLAKATPGPWFVADDNEGEQRPLWTVQNDAFHTGGEDDAPLQIAVMYGGKDDAELIAAMHAALPALLQQLAERDAEVERLRDLSNKFMWQVRDTCRRAEAAERHVELLRNAMTTDELVTLNKLHRAERAREEACGLLRGVLERDRVNGECGCIYHSRKAEREYEAGTCPHQRIAAFIAAFIAANGAKP